MNASGNDAVGRNFGSPNHLHFLLHVDDEQASQWSGTEVAQRWMALYPPRGTDRNDD